MSQTACERCGRACTGQDSAGDKARMMRRAKTGVCINCATVVFLKQLENMHGGPGRFLPPGEEWAGALQHPHVQQQFAAVMKASGTCASPDEIDWSLVIANWDLGEPVKGGLF